jgi:hypothetical protein
MIYDVADSTYFRKALERMRQAIGTHQWMNESPRHR